MLSRFRKNRLIAGVSLSLSLTLLPACASKVKSFYIPSESMAPTLAVGDRIFADLSIYETEQPQRGDIILFRPTDTMIAEGAISPDVPFIARAIGLPGETIEVREGSVYINSQPLQEDYIAEPPTYVWGLQFLPIPMLSWETTATTPTTVSFGALSLKTIYSEKLPADIGRLEEWEVLNKCCQIPQWSSGISRGEAFGHNSATKSQFLCRTLRPYTNYKADSVWKSRAVFWVQRQKRGDK